VKKIEARPRPKVIVKDEKSERRYETYMTKFFELHWPTEQANAFAKHLQKLIDARKEWAGLLYLQIMKRMRPLSVEEAQFVMEKIQHDETVIAIADEFKKKHSIDENPKQKTIQEVTKKK